MDWATAILLCAVVALLWPIVGAWREMFEREREELEWRAEVARNREEALYPQSLTTGPLTPHDHAHRARTKGGEA